MKRLTKRLSNGEAILDCDNCELQQSYECGEILCRDRLRNRVAAYEDTALEPEEVATIKLAMMGKSIAAVEAFNGMPISRLIELAEADKDGRCVVLSCKVYETDGVRVYEHAVRGIIYRTAGGPDFDENAIGKSKAYFLPARKPSGRCRKWRAGRMVSLSPYEMECREIKRICDKYGHGNVMEWASALWRREARAQGFPEDGCFVPTCPSFIKRKYQNPKQHELYDGFVKKILGTRKDDQQ